MPNLGLPTFIDSDADSDGGAGAPGREPTRRRPIRGKKRRAGGGPERISSRPRPAATPPPRVCSTGQPDSDGLGRVGRAGGRGDGWHRDGAAGPVRPRPGRRDVAPMANFAVPSVAPPAPNWGAVEMPRHRGRSRWETVANRWGRPRRFPAGHRRGDRAALPQARGRECALERLESGHGHRSIRGRRTKPMIVQDTRHDCMSKYENVTISRPRTIDFSIVQPAVSPNSYYFILP